MLRAEEDRKVKIALDGEDSKLNLKNVVNSIWK
jgi:hypothetical protein